jgi:uncharacterized OB-fold protein/acyl dehydratase
MMNPEEKKAFEKQIHAYVGKEFGPTLVGQDDVNQAMVRQWCEVMGDANPAYTDAEWAAKSSRGGTIAPPSMLHIWVMQGYPMAFIKPDDPPVDRQRELHQVFDKYGYKGVVATNCTTEFFTEAKPGDTIHSHSTFDAISDEKATGIGTGYFIETVTTFTNQDGEKLGSMVFRVLKFIPTAQPAAAEESGGGAMSKDPTRLAPAVGHDNKWWWDAVNNDDKVLIQRCKSCETLRHPPRPMCHKCQSVEWDSVESTLEGTVNAFCVMEYPEIPGYSYPLVGAVIDLAEGTRLVSNVVDVDPDDMVIGMKVTGKVVQVDEDTKLPQFYPVKS